MRLSIILLFIGLVSIKANTYSQSIVSLNAHNKSLKSIFSDIEARTNYIFLLTEDVEKDTSTKINIIINEESIEDSMNKILKSTQFDYKIINRQVVVYKKGVAPDIVKATNRVTETQQQITKNIKGKVIDKNTGEPLPGASVISQENGKTVNGTATNEYGNFELIIHQNVTTLSVSFIGYVTQNIILKDDDKTITISLEEDTQSFDDVVVTGYFQKSKSSFTGAVTQVSKEEIQKYGKTNIINILSQVDPTFKIKENNDMGSNPNELPNFFIRGEGSFLGGSNIPTFIVDGYEVSLQYIFDMDIDRIESLTILKDASATIHYGSRAANGVIVIETRRPEAGELRVSYTNRSSLSVPDLTDYNLMNAREKLEFEKLAGIYTSEEPKEQHRLNKVYNSIASDIARGVDTYWLSQPLRNAFSHGHSLYASGGDQKVTYGLGINYDNKAGVMKKSYRDNYGLNFDLTYRIKDKFTIRNSFSYNNTKSVNSPYGSFTRYTSANPYSPTNVKIFDQHDTYRHVNYLQDALLGHKNEDVTETVTNNLSLDYFLTPNFRLKSSLSLMKSNLNGFKFHSPLSSTDVGIEINKRGQYDEKNGKKSSFDFSTTLTYTLQKNKHTLYSGIGVNLQERKESMNSYSVTGFLDERFSDIRFAQQFKDGTRPFSTDHISRLAGFMGNANYSFDNRYFVDFSARADGSSKYGTNQKFGTFWSVGAGWNIHKESFLKDTKWLEEFKLRGSLGETGNQNFDPKVAKTIFDYYVTEFYHQTFGAIFSQFGNENLKWQKSLKRNIGLDFSLLKRRLSFRFDYYNDKTLGLLLPVTVAPSLGFSSYTENYGEQLNQGYEFNISGVVVRNKDFDLALYASGTHNKNKILRITNVLAKLNETNNADEKQFTKPVALYEEGESLSAIKAVRSMGIDPETGKELYLTKDGKITEKWDYKDKIKLGDTAPALMGTFGTNAMWKQLSLNLNFRYSIGSQLYNATLAERVEGADPRLNADRRVLEERWKKPGDHSFYKNIADRSVSYASSRFVQNNNYLELTNVSLQYHIDQELLKKIGLNSLRIGANMNDVFYISTVKRERGLEYPYARQFTFTLNLKF
ncbi:MAG: SusC/RagA family TonB-linked outer membrane protein [Bacteroidia bacterium]|nr:SusC/RagA family TonB-linked outer membrane protein [Bacteroidia bacterium]